MGLLTSKVEGTEENATASVDAAATAPAVTAPAETPAQTAAKAIAVHNAAQGGAVATHKAKGNARILDQMKDAMTVDYDTLAGLKLTQGRIIDADTEANLGESVVLQLLSWQESWMVAPGDMKADKKLIRYADNPETATDGTNLNKHLENLIEMGFDKAKKQHRCVLVGALVSAEKGQGLVGQLVQLNMSPKSKTAFDRYRMGAVWGITSGKLSDEAVQTVKLTAVLAKGPNDSDYTKAQFETYVAPAA